jgi:hypothetical protein
VNALLAISVPGFSFSICFTVVQKARVMRPPPPKNKTKNRTKQNEKKMLMSLIVEDK